VPQILGYAAQLPGLRPVLAGPVKPRRCEHHLLAVCAAIEAHGIRLLCYGPKGWLYCSVETAVRLSRRSCDRHCPLIDRKTA
jgi:hypothetical protein